MDEGTLQNEMDTSLSRYKLDPPIIQHLDISATNTSNTININIQH